MAWSRRGSHGSSWARVAHFPRLAFATCGASSESKPRTVVDWWLLTATAAAGNRGLPAGVCNRGSYGKD